MSVPCSGTTIRRRIVEVLLPGPHGATVRSWLTAASSVTAPNPSNVPTPDTITCRMPRPGGSWIATRVSSNVIKSRFPSLPDRSAAAATASAPAATTITLAATAWLIAFIVPPLEVDLRGEDARPHDLCEYAFMRFLRP
jgi:hypothetical protein